MPKPLSGLSVAILITDGFEQDELTEPKLALEGAGALVHVVSPKPDAVTAWYYDRWGDRVTVDTPLEKARPEHYDALVLPGGVMNPDSLRSDTRAVEFVRAFFRAGKPVAAICHGPWLLVDAGVLRGRRATSYPSIRADLENAGAEWMDQEVVVDQRLITSRKPDDLPAFNREIIAVLSDAAAHGGHPA
jgi:protease I